MAFLITAKQNNIHIVISDYYFHTRM